MNLFDLKQYMHLPYLSSKDGGKVDDLIVYVHWLMLLLFIGWSIYFAYVLFRFRARKNPRADYVGVRGNMSTWLEVGVAGVEMVLLIGFAVPLWSSVVSNPPNNENPTVVRVVAEQFAWTGYYPGADGKFGKQNMNLVSRTNVFGIDYTDPHAQDDVVGPSNLITVPVNRPVITHISSKDVIHSFKILQMRVTQDAIPGMSVPVWFTPTVPGKYTINCAQLCGNGHYRMKGNFHVVTEEEFQQFLENARSEGAGGVSYE